MDRPKWDLWETGESRGLTLTLDTKWLAKKVNTDRKPTLTEIWKQDLKAMGLSISSAGKHCAVLAVCGFYLELHLGEEKSELRWNGRVYTALTKSLLAGPERVCDEASKILCAYIYDHQSRQNIPGTGYGPNEQTTIAYAGVELVNRARKDGLFDILEIHSA